MRPRGLAKWANDDEEAYTHSLCVCVDVCGGDNNCTNIIIYSTPDNIFLRCEWGWTKIECVRMQNDWMTTIMVGTVKSHKCMHHHVVYECAILFHYIYFVMAWANTLHSAIESYKLIFYGIRRVDARPLRFRQYNATHTHTRSRVQIRTRPVDSCTCGVEREAKKLHEQLVLKFPSDGDWFGYTFFSLLLSLTQFGDRALNQNPITVANFRSFSLSILDAISRFCPMPRASIIKWSAN